MEKFASGMLRETNKISTFIAFEKALLMQLHLSLGFIFKIQSKTRANKNQWDR